VPRSALLDSHDTLTPADHQRHRAYRFEVPKACEELEIDVRYAPAQLSVGESAPLVAAAIERQQRELADAIGTPLASDWTVEHSSGADEVSIENLLTISLDDAAGEYRGACHRHAADQHLTLSANAASPGLIPGPLPAGVWTLTLSAHTVASAQCEVWIQIGALIASS
jgi:hypothetical protein